MCLKIYLQKSEAAENKKCLFFKPYGIGDYAASAVLARAWSMPIRLRPCRLLPAPQPFERGRQAHRRHTCQSQNLGLYLTPECVFAKTRMKERVSRRAAEDAEEEEI